MNGTPHFEDEFATQVRLARKQLRLARSLDDDVLAAVASGRLAELEDLMSAHLAPVLSGEPV